MKVVSVNVALPREVTWPGTRVSTGIYKERAEGRVAVRKLNLDGDRQADLTVHGGPRKAVYCSRVNTTATGVRFGERAVDRLRNYLHDYFFVAGTGTLVGEPALEAFFSA